MTNRAQDCPGLKRGLWRREGTVKLIIDFETCYKPIVNILENFNQIFDDNKVKLDFE